MKPVTVISSDKDGADLHREQYKNPRFIRASGTADDGVINDAIQSAGTKIFLGLGDAWERIFGGKKCQ